jgi:putative transcriptional regulator
MKKTFGCARMALALSLAYILSAATLLYTPAASAGEPEPEGTIILVAKPELTDPVFARTVLIATPLPSGLHVGVILNRPTDKLLTSLFPQHAPSKQVRDPVYFGGPMLPDVLVALVTGNGAAAKGALKLGEGLFLVAQGEAIDNVIEKTPNAAHYFVGTVVWRPGELDAELRRGFWSVLDVEQDIVFARKPQDLWQELRRKSNGLRVQVRPGMRLASVGMDEPPRR